MQHTGQDQGVKLATLQNANYFLGDTHRSRSRKIAYFGNESLVEGTGGVSQLEGLGVPAMEE